MPILIRKQTTASLDIDPQRCFTPLCPDELPVPEGESIVGALNAQADYARLRIATKDAHPNNPVWLADALHPPGSSLASSLESSPDNSIDSPVESPLASPKKSPAQPHARHYWPRHAVPGTPGFKLLPGLPHPSEYDYFVWKGCEPDMHPYGACYHDLNERVSTGLIEYLKLNRITTVLAGGLATDYCVKETVLQLRRADFEVIVNLEACRGLEPATTDAAISQMQAAGATTITGTHALHCEAE